MDPWRFSLSLLNLSRWQKVFVVHVAFNEKAFIIPSELRCAQVLRRYRDASTISDRLSKYFSRVNHAG
ncbi:hypothetical protein F2P79_011655 [Pimephales promelas]|nr:hypothetical protein F2P79_011655 [Pimephales promelas]